MQPPVSESAGRFGLMDGSVRMIRSQLIMTPARRSRSALPRLDDQTLHGAAEITLDVTEARGSDARAIRPDPAFGVQQNPLADRQTRQADGEVGVDERPFAEVEHRGGAVAEIG